MPLLRLPSLTCLRTCCDVAIARLSPVNGGPGFDTEHIEDILCEVMSNVRVFVSVKTLLNPAAFSCKIYTQYESQTKYTHLHFTSMFSNILIPQNNTSIECIHKHWLPIYHYVKLLFFTSNANPIITNNSDPMVTNWINSVAPGEFEWNFRQVIFKLMLPKWLMTTLFLVRLPSNECHWTLLMRSLHWFR